MKTSRYSYPDTIARLTAAISAAGNVIFASIDQADAARAAGLTLRPTTLIVFGNPKGGTPLMDGYPLAALALPLKLLVWEDSSTTRVAYARMGDALGDGGVPADDPRIAGLERALDTVSDSVV